jgi:hypothetical protein
LSVFGALYLRQTTLSIGGPPVMTTDAAADTGPKSKGKVFISYSRKDSAAFADDLVLGLEDRGFAPFLDRHDIKPGEPWEARLGGLIEQSDTVVFVISPGSVRSERCVWEVDKAFALSKRILPVIYKSVPDGEIPPKLSSLQFVRFDNAPSMMRPLRELGEALCIDLEWIREHTRLDELAVRWQSRNRPESLLLRGDDLDAAKAWVTKRKPDAPPTTELQRAFLNASERAEVARLAESKAARRRMRRRRFAWATAGVLLLLATYYFFVDVTDWLAIEDSMRPADFQHHLAKFPLSIFVSRAGDKLAGLNEFYQVKGSRSIQELKEYADKYPTSLYHPFVTLRLSRLRTLRAGRYTPVLADSSRRRLTAEDINALDCTQLWTARNEIPYAVGYCFMSDTTIDKFITEAECPYKRCELIKENNSLAYGILSSIETSNMNYLLLREGELGCPSLPNPFHCN